MFGFGGRVDTLLGTGAEFRGNLTVEGACVIDGRVEGNVTATERVTLGQHGSVKGNVTAPDIVVGGKVSGHVHASGRAELLGGCHIEGDIRTPRLTVAEGARFDGKVGMEGAGGALEQPEYKFAKK
jgi:cytoskeletal protein CcmA (bactofilin family)